MLTIPSEEDSSTSLSLAFLDEPARYRDRGDHHAHVVYKDPQIEAQHNVWLEKESWETFVQQLQDCEQKRTGTAQLDSMSPGELQISLESASRPGVFMVHLRLQWPQSHTSLQTTYELAHDCLMQLAQAAKSDKEMYATSD
jgi:hypothetical protein